MENTESSTSKALIAEAVALGRGASVILLHLGLPSESEGADRESLELPEDQIALVKAYAAAGLLEKTVVLLSVGAPVALEGWCEKVKCMLLLHLGGQGISEGAVNILRGCMNPSGHLGESWCARIEDYPSSKYFTHQGNSGNLTSNSVVYGEGLNIGYRSPQIKPVFPFGHGLSYTTFDFEDFRFDLLTLTVYVTVTNTGKLPGKAVLQLYVSHIPEHGHPAPDEPALALKQFAITGLLEPNGVELVLLQLTRKDFAFWDEALAAWRVLGGNYRLQLGVSSQDIRVTTVAKLPPLSRVSLSPYIDPEDLESPAPGAAGGSGPVSGPVGTSKYPTVHRNTTIYELAKFHAPRFHALRVGIMPQLFEKVPDLVKLAEDGPLPSLEENLLFAFLIHSPLRNLCSAGILDENQLTQIIMKLNTIE